MQMRLSAGLAYAELEQNRNFEADSSIEEVGHFSDETRSHFTG